MLQIWSKIKEISLYLLVFLLPWQTRFIFKYGSLNNTYWEYGSLSLYLTDIILILMVAATLLTKVKFRKIKYWKTYWYFLIIWEIFLLLSALGALSVNVAIYHVLWFVFLALLIWLFGQEKFNWHKLANCFLASTVLQASLAIWQFFSQQTFACKYLGLAKHSSEVLGTAVIETASGRWLRSYGGLDHPNILGAFLALGVVTAIYLLLSQARYKFDFKRLKISVWLWAVLLLNFLALFFTFSRAAWLATLVGVVVIILPKLTQTRYYKQSLKISVALLFFSFLLINSFGFLVLSRFDFSNRLEQISLQERSSQLEQAKQIIIQHPWLGVGAGNYSLALQEQTPGQAAFVYQPIHNSWLLLWAEVGILGALSLALFLLYLLILSVKEKNSFKLALWLILMITFFSEHWLLSLHFGWLVLAVVSVFILYRE